MNAVATAVREILGLFVEDASLTVGILICLALAIYAFPQAIPRAEWRGLLLFIVLALVLLENVYRCARSRTSSAR